MKQTDKILNDFYPNSNLTDAQGLSRAYGNGKGIYIDGDKMYVSGTFGKGTFGGAVNDILADVGLPCKMTKYSQRYKDTPTALDENHEVQHLITHSLGSSVGAQITKDYPERELTLTTYGAPFISRRSKITDDYINFRSILDPVSIADRGAITVYTGSLNPFTNRGYITGYGDQGKDVSRSVEPVREITWLNNYLNIYIYNTIYV